MRFIGLDVHRDFCEVAIAEAGAVRLAARVKTEPEALALFAQSLGGDDEVALEVTGNALEIARIIEPHVARVVLANPKAVKGITRAGAKTDKIDAHAGEAARRRLPAGGVAAGRADTDPAPADLGAGAAGQAAHTRQEPGARDDDPQPQGQTAGERSVRRPRAPLARRAGLPNRRAGDGRVLPAPDRVPRPRDRLAREGPGRAGARLNGDAAAAHPHWGELRHRRCAARCDRRHRSLPDLAPTGQLPRSRPTRNPVWLGAGPARTDQQAGPRRDPTRAGRGGLARRPRTRPAARLPRAGCRPPRRQHRDRRCRAQARRDRLAHAQPRRRLCLRPSLAHPREAPPARTDDRRRQQKGKRIGVFATKEQHDLDKQLAAQAELAYRRLAQDWQPAIKGTGAAPGHASRRPSSGQAARQETAPPPAL